ncbi:MAG: hypothetical protein WA682_10960 [Acidobacteriaceae bacterium]
MDAVIRPSETRLRLIRALEMLDTKREKILPKNTATSRYRAMVTFMVPSPPASLPMQFLEGSSRGGKARRRVCH